MQRNINHQNPSDVKLKVLLIEEIIVIVSIWRQTAVTRSLQSWGSHLWLLCCVLLLITLWKTNQLGWRARHSVFISTEVEVNAFIWSVRVLLFRVCRDGHMASACVLYIHPFFLSMYMCMPVFGTGQRTLSTCHVVPARCLSHTGEDRWTEFSFSIVYNSHRQWEEQRARATEH